MPETTVQLLHHGAAANSSPKVVVTLPDTDELVYASHLILNVCHRQRVRVMNDRDEHVWNVTHTLRTRTSATTTELATAAANVSTLTAKRVITCVRRVRNDGLVCGFSDGTLTSWHRRKNGDWKERVLPVVHQDDDHPQASVLEGRSVTDVDGYCSKSKDDDSTERLAVVACCSGGAFLFTYQKDETEMQLIQSRQLLHTPSNVCRYHELDDTLGVILVGTAAPRHNKIHVWTVHAGSVLGDAPVYYSGSLTGHEDWITCLDWTMPQTTAATTTNRCMVLASGSQDAKIRLWKWVTTTVTEKDTQQKALPSRVSTEGSEQDDTSDDDEDEDADADDEEMVEGEARLEIFHGNNQLTSVYLEALLIGHEEMVTSVAWHPNPQPIYQQDLILISGSMDRTIFIWSSTESNNVGYGIGSNSDDTGGVWTPIARVGSAGGILGGSVGSSLLGFLNVQAEPGLGRWIMGHAYGGALHFFSCQKIRELAESESLQASEKRTIEERAALIQWRAQPCVTGHFGEVTDLCWEAYRGDYLITVGNDQTCRLWAPMEKRYDVWIEVSRPQVHGYNISAVTSLSTAEHKHLLVTGADEKELRAFDGTLSFIRTLKMITGDSQAEGEPNGLRVERAYIPALGLTNKASAADGADEDTGGASKSDTRLLLERDLGSMSLWPEVRKLFGHNSEIARLTSTLVARSCLSAQYSTPYIGEIFVASTTKARDVEAAAIRIWDTDYRCKQILKGGHRSTVTALCFSPDGTYLVSSGKDRRLCIWKRRVTPTNDGELFFLAAAVDSSHKRIVWSAHFCPYDPTIFASGSRDGTVKLWKLYETATSDEESETEVKNFSKFVPRPGDSGSDTKASAVTSLSFAPLRTSDSMGLLAMGFEDGLMQLWSVPLNPDESAEPSLVTSFDPNMCHIGAVNKISWRPSSSDEKNDPLTLASCSDDCGCRIFRIDTSKS
jgi:elongator complex protein 2